MKSRFRHAIRGRSRGVNCPAGVRPGFAGATVVAIAGAFLFALALALVLVLAFPTAGGAETPVVAPQRKLAVGVIDAPPFLIGSETGSWSGLSIDLWAEVARRLGVDYEFRPIGAEDVPGLNGGKLDLVLSAIPLTPEGEKEYEFSVPFYATGLGIAVRANRGGKHLAAVLGRVFSRPFLITVGTLFIILFAVGAAMWLLERKRNPEHFDRSPAKGLGAAFWWSAVTMTTVGYGDVTPKTVLGRLVAIVWMFAAVILVSVFTASITSALTVSELSTSVMSASDLSRVRVASVQETQGERYLARHGIAFERFGSSIEALEALETSVVDAVVYDAPILRFEVKERFVRSLKVLPGYLERQFFAIVLPRGSALRKPVNEALLGIISEPDWDETIDRYLAKTR